MKTAFDLMLENNQLMMAVMFMLVFPALNILIRVKISRDALWNLPSELSTMGVTVGGMALFLSTTVLEHLQEPVLLVTLTMFYFALVMLSAVVVQVVRAWSLKLVVAATVYALGAMLFVGALTLSQRVADPEKARASREEIITEGPQGAGSTPAHSSALQRTGANNVSPGR